MPIQPTWQSRQPSILQCIFGFACPICAPIRGERKCSQIMCAYLRVAVDSQSAFNTRMVVCTNSTNHTPSMAVWSLWFVCAANKTSERSGYYCIRAGWREARFYHPASMDSSNLHLGNDISWSTRPTAIPFLASSKDKKKSFNTQDKPPKSVPCEQKLGPRVILDGAHNDTCNRSQGGYGYDVGIHWRILAAILYGIYTWFPLKTTSRIVGKLSHIHLPRFLRGPVLRSYAWLFSARLEEAEFHNDLARYSSISHFFRRRLIPSARPVDTKACLVSQILIFALDTVSPLSEAYLIESPLLYSGPILFVIKHWCFILCFFSTERYFPRAPVGIKNSSKARITALK